MSAPSTLNQVNPPTVQGNVTVSDYQVDRALETAVTIRAVLWFCLFALVVIAIIYIIYWIVISGDRKRNDGKFRRLETRDFTVVGDVEVQKQLRVGDTVKSENLVSTNTTSVEFLEIDDPQFDLTGRHSVIILGSSTSTPVQGRLPPGSAVPVGCYVTLFNQTMASSFVVYPAGTDTLNGTLSPVTVTGRSATFYCRGIPPTSSAFAWLQV